MNTMKEIAQRLWNRIARSQYRIQKLLIQKANELGICLLSMDMMVLIRENEKIVVANVLPKNRPLSSQFQDFAFLYLDLPTARVASGFYKLQLIDDTTAPQARLVDTDNQPIGTATYYGIDLFASIVGVKSVPVKKLPIFETFNKTNESYLIGGTHADGQAFVIALDL